MKPTVRWRACRAEGLDGTSDNIRYEEFHPYGSTAWWADDGDITISRKRYRYTGMERDEETGLSRHGVRMYATWLGRWTSSDPVGVRAGLNRFAYVNGGPIGSSDTSGYMPDDPPTADSTKADAYQEVVTRLEGGGADVGVLRDTLEHDLMVPVGGVTVPTPFGFNVVFADPESPYGLYHEGVHGYVLRHSDDPDLVQVIASATFYFSQASWSDGRDITWNQAHYVAHETLASFATEIATARFLAGESAERYVDEFDAGNLTLEQVLVGLGKDEEAYRSTLARAHGEYTFSDSGDEYFKALLPQALYETMILPPRYADAGVPPEVRSWVDDNILGGTLDLRWAELPAVTEQLDRLDPP